MNWGRRALRRTVRLRFALGLLFEIAGDGRCRDSGAGPSDGAKVYSSGKDRGAGRGGPREDRRGDEEAESRKNGDSGYGWEDCSLSWNTASGLVSDDRVLSCSGVYRRRFSQSF